MRYILISPQNKIVGCGSRECMMSEEEILNRLHGLTIRDGYIATVDIPTMRRTFSN